MRRRTHATPRPFRSAITGTVARDAGRDQLLGSGGHMDLVMYAFAAGSG